jgi:hypothetical protein
MRPPSTTSVCAKKNDNASSPRWGRLASSHAVQRLTGVFVWRDNRVRARGGSGLRETVLSHLFLAGLAQDAGRQPRG